LGCSNRQQQNQSFKNWFLGFVKKFEVSGAETLDVASAGLGVVFIVKLGLSKKKNRGYLVCLIICIQICPFIDYLK